MHVYVRIANRENRLGQSLSIMHLHQNAHCSCHKLAKLTLQLPYGTVQVYLRGPRMRSKLQNPYAAATWSVQPVAKIEKASMPMQRRWLRKITFIRPRYSICDTEPGSRCWEACQTSLLMIALCIVTVDMHRSNPVDLLARRQVNRRTLGMIRFIWTWRGRYSV